MSISARSFPISLSSPFSSSPLSIHTMTDIPITVPEILSVFATLKIHRSATTNPCRDITKIPSWRHKDAIPIYQSCKKTANRKNLRLLDGIALLLVTERTSDGAAVSMTNRAHGELIKTTIHMVKNRECTEKEKNYYETFIELINDSTINSVTLEDELSNLVLENCRAQIINRAVKLRRAIKRYRNVHRTWRAENSTIQKDISEFRKLYKLSAFKAPTWPELLDHFLLEGLHPDQFSTTEGGRALWLVHEFVINDHLLNSIPSLKVTSRLRKLAEYVQTLLTITKHVARKRRNRIFQLEIVSFPKSRLFSIAIINNTHILKDPIPKTSQYTAYRIAHHPHRPLRKSPAPPARQFFPPRPQNPRPGRKTR